MSDDVMVAQPIPDREAELDHLQSQVTEALSLAQYLGADGAEITAGMHAGMNVTARLGEVETIEHNQDRSISVTVLIGRSKGHASSADLRPESVRQCVEKAMDIARYTQEDRCNGLADPDRLATEFPDLDLWHPEPLDVNKALERALACEQAGREDDRISNSEGASVSGSLGLGVYGNSHGFLGRTASTRYGQYCVLIAGSGSNMQRDYSYDSRRRLQDLESPSETGRKAVEKTLARMNARQVPTSKMPVLFNPEMSRGLLGHLISGVSGSALYRNASFLKDCAGEQLFPEWFGLSERPFLLRGAASTSFDNEGVATADRELVEQGVLTGYVLSSYSARRLGLESTANAGGVHNLSVNADGEAFDALIRDMGHGLLVTEVMGQGVSMVTGDYSRGASGFMIENGEISYPVQEVTIAGNLREMFAGIRAVGNDVDDRANIRCGSMLIDGLTVAGS